MLPYLAADVQVTITVIREYITNRFKEYKTIQSALGPLLKPKNESKLPPPEINAGAALMGDGEGTAGRGGRSGRRGRGGGGWRGGKSGWSDKGNSQDGNTENKPPQKRTYEKATPSCAFCVAKKRPQTTHKIGVCPWISATSKSDLITALPNLCLGCFKLKTVGEHTCSAYLKDGGRANTSVLSTN